MTSFGQKQPFVGIKKVTKKPPFHMLLRPILYNYHNVKCKSGQIIFRKIMKSSSNVTIRRPHRIQTASAYSISPPRPLTARRKAAS